MDVRFSCSFCNIAEWTGCALRGDKRKEMLNAYGTARKARAVTQGPNQPYGNTSMQISTSGSWNEVIVDGSYWNKVVGANLDAFFIGVPCAMNADCKKDALRIVNEYKGMFGFAPPL